MSNPDADGTNAEVQMEPDAGGDGDPREAAEQRDQAETIEDDRDRADDETLGSLTDDQRGQSQRDPD